MESFEESLDKVKKGFASAVNKVKGNSEPEPVPEDEQSFFTESVTSVKKAFNLTLKQRIIGFGICVGISAGCSILGCALSLLNIAVFAVLFTVGTIAGLVSTFFLVGPITQAKKFIDTSNVLDTVMKVISAAVLVLAVALALLCALLWKTAIGAVMFCIVEFAALIWYSILLIPFASQFIRKTVSGVFKTLA